MQNAQSPGSKLGPDYFTQHPDVQKCITRLKQQFGNSYEKLYVSDAIDKDHQYVNLVQKGGGVLGVALVGYTYILEQAGIRFLRLAGTSAGAINTAMLTVIGAKQDAKSEKVLEYLCNLNFFDLVDGHPFARWLIRNFISNKKFEKKVKLWASVITGLFAGCVFFSIFFMGLQKYYSFAISLTRIFFVLTGFNLLLITGIVLYVSYMFSRLKNCGYGINPGKFFFKWIKDIMEENGVATVTDFTKKATASIPGLTVRKPETQNADTLKGDVTLITSELVSENKIEFPKMTKLFRTNPDELHPAQFVRASMSIPIFFESHIIPNIPVEDAAIQAAWKETFGQTDIPRTARFVDGGILSNFPINIFYNSKIVEPRLPSFGINLDDTDPKTEDDKNSSNWTLGSYIGRMFNTIRFYYDKDFLIKNEVFQKGIGNISLYEFNWLNFFLTDEDKLNMFIKGAQAATDFLSTFDWPKYQKERTEMQLTLNEKNAPEKVANPQQVLEKVAG